MLTADPQCSRQVGKLARKGLFDYVFIESTGISEPMQAAESFTMDVGGGQEEEER